MSLHLHFFILYCAGIILTSTRSFLLSSVSPRLPADGSHCSASPTRLHLYPITDELPPTIPASVCSQWLFSLLQKRDLDAAAALSNTCFYTPRVVINTEGAGQTELRFLEWLKGLHRRVDESDSYNGNYLGYLSRSGGRLDRPTLGASHDSFILVATKRTGVTAGTGESGSGERSGAEEMYVQSRQGADRSPLDSHNPHEIAGMVEVCLEKADGKLAPPIQLPWRGRLTGEEAPYLCNLCVQPSMRRSGLGTLLVSVAEQLVVRRSHRLAKPNPNPNPNPNPSHRLTQF